uniref:TGF_BETA_2 domain-containing protein n=1 Tax=Rhabditophanes sp. KR3021 TaxID=114890 RepID=A0AC35TXS9_9BILA
MTRLSCKLTALTAVLACVNGNPKMHYKHPSDTKLEEISNIILEAMHLDGVPYVDDDGLRRMREMERYGNDDGLVVGKKMKEFTIIAEGTITDMEFKIGKGHRVDKLMRASLNYLFTDEHSNVAYHTISFNVFAADRNGNLIEGALGSYTMDNSTELGKEYIKIPMDLSLLIKALNGANVIRLLMQIEKKEFREEGTIVHHFPAFSSTKADYTYLKFTIEDLSDGRAKRDTAKCNENRDFSCCLSDHEIDTQDLGFTFIISPKKLNIGGCRGDCSVRPVVTSMNSELARLVNRKFVGCCHAVEYAPVMFTYTLDNGMTQRNSTVNNVKATRCGCY